jgi:hypothetical protein
MRFVRCLPLVAALIQLAGPASRGQAGEENAALAPPVIKDAFGRDLSTAGITLVDWEGYLANPAPRFFIELPGDVALPARIVLRSAAPSLYFDLPSTVGADGPRKELEARSARDRLSFRLAVWPDRDGDNEEYELRVELTDAKQRRATARQRVRVLDQDRQREPEFRITLDFSRDRTGFFAKEENRRPVEQAAQDWAYFLADPGLEEVPAGAEETWIWEPDGFRKGETIKNKKPYQGFLVYAYGIQTPEVRSGGEPSRQGRWQRVRGKELPMRRSGGLEIEIRGNFNQRGWHTELPDDEWWRATNLRDVRNDLYSIAHHELGHTLAFNPAQPNFERFKTQGRWSAPTLRDYLGAAAKIDRADHFPETTDLASGKGAFGWEYHGEMPRCRWIITKFDLLAMSGVGYQLRDTSAFRPLVSTSKDLPSGARGRPYQTQLSVKGGTPAFCFDVVEGKLPTGLTLDSFTGKIAGTPRGEGRFSFTTRVRDSGMAGAEHQQAVNIFIE